MGNKVLTVEINADTSKLEASFKKIGEVSKVFNAAEASTIQLEQEKNRLLQEQAKFLQKGVDIADKIKAMPEKMQLSAMNAYLVSANKQMEQLATQAAKVNSALSQSYLKDIASSSKATQANTATLLANQYAQALPQQRQVNQGLEETKTKVAAVVKEHKNILLHVGEIILSYRTLNSAINLAQQALLNIPKAGIEQQATKSSIFAIFGSEAGQQNLNFLKNIADNAGQSIKTLEETYRRFAPSAALAGANQAEINKAFKDFSEVGTIMHLPEDKLNSLFLALDQMYAKGKVQSEEIKKQLGNVLPGAVEIGAKAWENYINKTKEGSARVKVSVAEFMDAMKKNLVDAKNFIPEFAALNRQIYGGVDDSVFKNTRDMLFANIQRVKNNYELLSRDIFSITENMMNSVVKSVRDGLKSLDNGLSGIANTVTLVAELISVRLAASLAALAFSYREITLADGALGKQLNLVYGLQLLSQYITRVVGLAPSTMLVVGSVAALVGAVNNLSVAYEENRGVLIKYGDTSATLSSVLSTLYDKAANKLNAGLEYMKTLYGNFFQWAQENLPSWGKQIVSMLLPDPTNTAQSYFMKLAEQVFVGSAMLPKILSSKSFISGNMDKMSQDKELTEFFKNTVKNFRSQADLYFKQDNLGIGDTIAEASVKEINESLAKLKGKPKAEVGEAIAKMLKSSINLSKDQIKQAYADAAPDIAAPTNLFGSTGNVEENKTTKAKKGFNERKAIYDQELKYQEELAKLTLENLKADYDRDLISFGEYIGKKAQIELSALATKQQTLKEQLAVANASQKPAIQGELNRLKLEMDQKGIDLTRERNDLEQKYGEVAKRTGIDIINNSKSTNDQLASMVDNYNRLTMSARNYFLETIKNKPETEQKQLIAQYDKGAAAQAQKDLTDKATSKLQAYIDKIKEGKGEASSFKDVANAAFSGSLDGIGRMVGAFELLTKSMKDNSNALKENSIAQATSDNDLAEGRQSVMDWTVKKSYLDEENARINSEATADQLSGLTKLTGATASLFSKKSSAARALHSIEMGLAVARMAMNAKEMAQTAIKTVTDVASGAAKMFSQSGWLGFAGVAAMLAVMAALGFAGSSAGGNKNYIPDSPDSGTVLGDTEAKSNSTKNTYDLLKSIHAKEYAELRGINDGVNSLTKGISGWVTKFFQSGGLSKLSAEQFISGGARTQMDPIGKKIENMLMGVPKIVAQGVFIAKQNLELIGNGIDIIAKEFADIEKKGLLGSSKKTVFRPLGQLLIDGLTDVFVNAKKVLRSTIEFFGVDLQDMVTSYILPRIKINLKGKNAEKAAEKMTNVLSTALDKMTQTIMGDIISKYQQLGEGLFETAIRIQAQAVVTKEFLKSIGSSIQLENFEWANFSQDLIDFAVDTGTAADKLKELQKMMVDFISSFAPENVQNAQKFTAFTGEMAYAFSKLKGDNVQQLVDGFFDSVKATKSLGEAIYRFTAGLGTNNTEVIAEMLKLGDAAKEMSKFFAETLKPVTDQIKTLTDSIDTTSIEDLMATLSNSKDITQQKNLVAQLQKKIMDKYNTELNSIKTIKNALFDLSKVVKKLLLGDLSTLDPRQKFEEAQKQYLDLLAQVNSSDVVKAAEAANQLGTAAETYLQEAKKYYGATESYAQIFQAVTNTLNSLSNTVLDKDQAIIDATRDLATAAIGQLNTLASTYIDSFNAYLKEQIDLQKTQLPAERQPTFLEGLYAELAKAIGSGNAADKATLQRKVDAYQLGGMDFYNAVISNNTEVMDTFKAKAAIDIKDQQDKIKALTLEKNNKNTSTARGKEITKEIADLKALIAKEKKLIKFKADGGVSSGYTMVGERGPELLYLPSNTKVINNTNTNRMLDNARKEELEYLAGIKDELSNLNSRMATIERKTRLTSA